MSFLRELYANASFGFRASPFSAGISAAPDPHPPRSPLLT
jgi:hypothetical protein